MPYITTTQLRKLPVDLYLTMDEDVFCYRGATEQADGSVAVHLEYADASASKLDIEVAKQDLDEALWDYDPEDC